MDINFENKLIESSDIGENNNFTSNIFFIFNTPYKRNNTPLRDLNTKYQTDNNLNYEKEFNIISKYFTLNLIEKNDI